MSSRPTKRAPSLVRWWDGCVVRHRKFCALLSHPGSLLINLALFTGGSCFELYSFSQPVQMPKSNA